MEGKDSFILYKKYINIIKALSLEQRGKLITHIFEYVNDYFDEEHEDKIDDASVLIAWLAIKTDLKEDLVKWKKTCSERSKAGKLGAEVKKQKQANQANANFAKNETSKNKQTKANQADNDCEYDCDNDNVNDNVNVIKENSIKEKSPTSRFVPPTIDQIRDYCIERNNLVDPERFYNFYQAKGWMVGKNKMKDWKAAVRTWEKDSGFKGGNDSNDNGGFDVL